MKTLKPDTDTWAERDFRGWEIYMRREFTQDKWEFSAIHTPPQHVCAVKNDLAGYLVQGQLSHPILKETFDSPDQALKKLIPIVSQF